MMDEFEDAIAMLIECEAWVPDTGDLVVIGHDYYPDRVVRRVHRVLSKDNLRETMNIIEVAQKGTEWVTSGPVRTVGKLTVSRYTPEAEYAIESDQLAKDYEERLGVRLAEKSLRIPA